MDYQDCRRLLLQRLAEVPPTQIQLLAGPRQVGKTTLLLDLAKEAGVQSLYSACDGPEAALPGFWDGVWTRAEAITRAHGRAIVLLDEVHVWATGLHDSRVNGTASGAGGYLFMLSRPARQRFGWAAARARVSLGGLNG